MIPRRLLTLASVLSFALGASAQPQPKVVFIGDAFNVLWQQSPQFQANANWVPMGFQAQGPGAGKGTGPALAELQTIVQQGQHPIVHLLVGEADADGGSPGNQDAFLFRAFASNMEGMISMAQKANIKLIIGTIPFTLHGDDIGTFNKWLTLYCNLHNVPLVDYATALSGAGFAASRSPTVPPPVYLTGATDPVSFLPTLTPAGYALITDMAQTQIGLTSGQFKLVRGYLNDVGLPDLEDAESIANVNSVVDGTTFSSHRMANTVTARQGS